MNATRKAQGPVVPDPMPVEPVQPALEDCCRSGCTPCVFDLYDDALDLYRKELAAWRLRHPGGAPKG